MKKANESHQTDVSINKCLPNELSINVLIGSLVVSLQRMLTSLSFFQQFSMKLNKSFLTYILHLFYCRSLALNIQYRNSFHFELHKWNVCNGLSGQDL